ncbi:MAG: GNAT family N-acetyltransferase [Mycobacteriales bacterium]
MAEKVEIRPLEADDAGPAWQMAYTSLRLAGRSYGWEMPELTDDIRERGRRRVLHCLTHDLDGAFVAERDGAIVGVSLATRRDSLWFLSLLAVDTEIQAQGVGGQLLDASLRTLGTAGTICASDDPKALRRYRRAGFDLLPGFEAKGALDRSLLPAVRDVVEGSYADDRDMIEEVAWLQRDAPHGPDLDFFADSGRALFVTNSARGRGYVVCADAGPAVLAATTAPAAEALLWTALAETTADELDVLWLRHDQQWALDVLLDARLSLRPSGSFCVRGAVGPMSPYIPSGALG